MKRIILWTLLALVILVIGLSVFVAIDVGPDLSAARAALTGSSASLDPQEIDKADRHLRSAVEGLSSAPARLLGLVPVARQNLAAVRAAATETGRVLDASRRLQAGLDDIQGGLLSGGRVDLDLLGELQAPLSDQAQTLAALRDDLERHRNGWLLPPVWSAVDDLLVEARDLHDGAQSAADLIEVAGPILGEDGQRTYLVVLMNNNELRGAGGIPSGVGTITAKDGQLGLGRFYYARSLDGEPPYERVPAPADFRRRFARYLADTRFWVNTTFSPDVPDVAVVASRLFKVSTGKSSDGVLLIDPRGVAALTPPDVSLEVPGGERTLTAEEFPAYSYSGSYEVRRRADGIKRHDELLVLGQRAFAATLQQGLGDTTHLRGIGRAALGGHLRFISFEEREQELLEEAGVTGDLSPPEGDHVLVTAQNTGANKLDYWARRTVVHTCDLADGATATCGTTVTLDNETPPDLSVGGTPYGLLSDFLEVYIPLGARVTYVAKDGEPSGFVDDHQDGHRAVGVEVEIPRATEMKVEVAYELAVPEEGYSLTMTPQPLARDARVEVNLALPGGWDVRGPGEIEDGVLRYAGVFDRELEFRAGPSDRTGIPGLWARLVNFWSEPVL